MWPVLAARQQAAHQECKGAQETPAAKHRSHSVLVFLSGRTESSRRIFRPAVRNLLTAMSGGRREHLRPDRDGARCRTRAGTRRSETDFKSPTGAFPGCPGKIRTRLHTDYTRCNRLDGGARAALNYRRNTGQFWMRTRRIDAAQPRTIWSLVTWFQLVCAYGGTVAGYPRLWRCFLRSSPLTGLTSAARGGRFLGLVPR